MNDDILEREIRATLRLAAPAGPPAALERSAAAIPRSVRRPRFAPGPFGRFANAAAAVAGVAVIGVAVLAIVVASAGFRAGVLGGGGGGAGGGAGAGGMNPVHFATPYVTLEAADFSIVADGKTYLATGATVDVHSDPGDAYYRTLELTWNEQGVEMRLYMYFRSDASDWWVYELRTYDGRSPGEWITYEGPFFRTPLGQAFTGTVDLASPRGSAVAGSVHFTDLHLTAF